MPSLFFECTTANSTPNYGYWENLALAITCKIEAHFTALWGHEQMKLWSIHTMSEFLSKAGVEYNGFERLGRTPSLAKSMIAKASGP